MGEHKHNRNRLELRRLRYAEERRRAQRAQSIADWLKYIAAMVVAIALTATAYIVCRHFARKAEDAAAEVLVVADARRLADEAIDRLAEKPDDALAWAAFLIGSGIVYGRGA